MLKKIPFKLLLVLSLSLTNYCLLSYSSVVVAKFSEEYIATIFYFCPEYGGIRPVSSETLLRAYQKKSGRNPENVSSLQ